GDVTESGAPALFENLPVFWQGVERRPEFAALFKNIIALRHDHAALRQAATEWVRNSDPDRVVTFRRRAPCTERGGCDDEWLVAVNLSNRPYTGAIAVPSAGFTEVTVIPSNAKRSAWTSMLALDAWDFRIFRRPPSNR